MNIPGVWAGDIFCAETPWLIGRWITVVSGWLSRDGAAEHGHAGIIINAKGDTIEALTTVRTRNIYKDFTGKRILIARPIKDLNGQPLNSRLKKTCMHKIIKIHLGQWYPWWRIPLNLIPPLAKVWGDGNHLVCSEIVAKYESLLPTRHKYYMGVSPDTLADEWRHWKQQYKIIFNGTVI